MIYCSLNNDSLNNLLKFFKVGSSDDFQSPSFPGKTMQSERTVTPTKKRKQPGRVGPGSESSSGMDDNELMREGEEEMNRQAKKIKRVVTITGDVAGMATREIPMMINQFRWGLATRVTKAVFIRPFVSPQKLVHSRFEPRRMAQMDADR